jgi:hypothetical protein
MEKGEQKLAWSKDEVEELLKYHLFEMLECRTAEGVDVAVAYATFMSKMTVTPDNYPVFFHLLKMGNHWVADAVIAGTDPSRLFRPVQPNSYMISESLKIMKAHQPGALYGNVILAILDIVRIAYEYPSNGFRLLELDANDINNIGKHLAADKNPSAPVNSVILHILDHIAGLHTPGGLPIKNKEIEKASIQANNIRGKFLDPSKNLSEAIPEKLLVLGDNKKQETAPTKPK